LLEDDEGRIGEPYIGEQAGDLTTRGEAGKRRPRSGDGDERKPGTVRSGALTGIRWITLYMRWTLDARSRGPKVSVRIK
jgi:hypothetical protein